jgi:GntR family transcriptional regulator / MocR family aminotransferase
MTQERILVDRQGDSVLECAIAELLEDGDVQRHVRRTRRIYHARRDALCELVDSELGQVLAYTRPAGGLSLWATTDPRVDLEAWQRRGLERGVYFQIGTQFSLDGSPVQAIRLGYALLDEKEQLVAVRRLAASLPVRFSGSRPARATRA